VNRASKSCRVLVMAFHMATLKRDGPQADSSCRSETLGYRSAKMRAKR
jgi:hypothetical protein